MKTYKANFYKYEKEQDEKGNVTKTKRTFLGSITLDDAGTSREFTIHAKAFRHAPDTLAIADSIVLEQVRS